MTRHTTATKRKNPNERDVSAQAIVCEATGVTLLKDAYLELIMPLPLPGIVIFVHGVNSDGEWYDQTEEGLCAGLNDRLKRRDEHMAYPSAKGGQLTPARYTAELTKDGFLNPDRSAKTFLQPADHCSTVIRFRWGYKANAEELQNYGDAIYLNEENYWGGGPFANGCTSLPDLWNEGLSANLFLWLQVQHLNPDHGRQVFSCPHRAYYVLAALRLAKLVASIREAQADVPITIVCHSQGNMIGMAAAFLGDRMPGIHDSDGKFGRCVADSYVLCNPPYSLVESNFTEHWTQTHMEDAHGGTGRQTMQARIDTLKAFFGIIRRPAAPRQEAAEIDLWMANTKHQFDAAADRERYGFGTPKHTCGRVTLYCNPHDQVISSSAVRGIGWLGMSAEEIMATDGADVFCQRVFAQGFEVGTRGNYHYWENHHGKGVSPGSWDFWTPPSPRARYSIAKGVEASRQVGSILTVGLAPLIIVAMWLGGIRINDLPPKKWRIPLDAPELPDAFLPQGLRFGQRSEQFDEYCSPPGQQRDPHRQREADDPYAGDRPIGNGKGDPERAQTDAGKGTEDSEARLRYEDHARLRMQARREGIVAKGAKVVQEDEPDKASGAYKVWRNRNIKANLAATIDANATDHSTIMTNPVHAQRALAYDVAVGVSRIAPAKLARFRIAADWRLQPELTNETGDDPECTYFKYGMVEGQSTAAWIRQTDEAKMPAKIADRRESSAASK